MSQMTRRDSEENEESLCYALHPERLRAPLSSAHPSSPGRSSRATQKAGAPSFLSCTSKP